MYSLNELSRRSAVGVPQVHAQRSETGPYTYKISSLRDGLQSRKRARLRCHSSKRSEERRLDSENGNCGRRRLGKGVCRLWRVGRHGNWERQELGREYCDWSGQIHRNVCRPGLDCCVPVGRGWRFPLAAPLRGWHIHASALALHSLAASVFSRAQACVGKSAGHRRSHQRQEHSEDQCELAESLHPGLSFNITSILIQFGRVSTFVVPM